MFSISTYLIERNAPLKKELEDLLVSTNYHVEETNPDFFLAIKDIHSKSKTSLIIVDARKDTRETGSLIRSIRSYLPECRIVVIASKVDPPTMIEFFLSGADGYILHEIALPVLIGSLDMIMMGEKIYPEEMLNFFVEKIIKDRKTSFNPDKHSLSKREELILASLTAGKTNKQIAKNLDITEETVKVHVKTVLRKLDLSNRTQAAVWAASRGITEKDFSLQTR